MKMESSKTFLQICMLTVAYLVTKSVSFEDKDAGFIKPADLELAKDILSLLTETTVQSKCDGNVFVVSEECQDFIGLSLMSLSKWAPPITIVSFTGPTPFPEEIKRLWTKFLAWDRRPCSLIFVCDLVQSKLDEEDNGNFTAYEEENDSFTAYEEDSEADVVCSETSTPKIETSDQSQPLVFSSFPKFFTHSDQIIYLSYMTKSEELLLSKRSQNDFEISVPQAEILQQTGTMLWIGIRETSNTPEAIMDVYTKCEFCGSQTKLHQALLGSWQRNRTQFVFFEQFENFQKASAFNYSEIKIGYFNHPPHIKCMPHFLDVNVNRSCAGVEWEILSQMGRSMHFDFTLVHLGSNEDQQRNNGKSVANISRMISALQEGKVDFAVGGISVTSERIALIDFSRVFATEPIVFVVEKSNSIFVLGIWLAFEPEVWPLILLIMAIISILFKIIINRSSLPGGSFLGPKSLSLSFYINRKLFYPKKPALVRMFKALEITLQPLLGQPLTSSQITNNPRRLLKLLLILWWFASLIITTLYSTSLITSLINPVRSREPESLKDLINFGYYFKLENNQGSVFELIASIPDLTENPDEVLDRTSGNIQSNLTEDQQKTLKLFLMIKSRLVKNTDSVKLVAYIMDESAVKSFNWTARNISPSHLKIIRERLFLNGYGFAMKPKTSYKAKIDTALSRLGSSGLIDFWYSLFNHQDKQVKGNKFRLRQKLSHVKLDLKILQGAFIFLVFGCTFSAVVFGVEHITKRYKFQVYTKNEVMQFLSKMRRQVVSFYDQHLAEDHPVVETNRIQQERFRKAAVTIVKLNSRNPFKYVK